MLTQLMKAARVTVVFTSMSEEVEALFRAHAVINAQTTVVIPYLDDALEWCEEEILLRYVLCVMYYRCCFSSRHHG
jgi:hypothetical protein